MIIASTLPGMISSAQALDEVFKQIEMLPLNIKEMSAIREKIREYEKIKDIFAARVFTMILECFKVIVRLNLIILILGTKSRISI